MKRTTVIFVMLLLAVLLPATAKAVGHQLSGAGDIIVDIRDELGHTLNGASVDLRLPGPSGTLDVGFNTIITHIDGNAVPGTADADGLGQDGDVEFSNNFSAYINSGQNFRITVIKDGYVNYVQEFAWNSITAPNVVASANKYTVKVVLKEELGNTITTGGQIAITGGATVSDGGIGDGDGAANGAIYIAQSPTGPGTPAAAVLTSNGYLSYNDNTRTISANAQAVYITTFQFPFRITAQDEAGAGSNVLTLVAADSTIGGTLTQVALKSNGGTLYLAASGGPSTIALTESGFLTSTTVGPYTYNPAVGTAQQLIRFQAALGEGPALVYSVHVTSAEDELTPPNPVGLPAGTPFTATGFTIKSQVVNGVTGYVAATSVPGTLFLAVNGYVTSESVNFTPPTGAGPFTAVAFAAADPIGVPLEYAFRINQAQTDELTPPNALNLTGAETVQLFTNPDCNNNEATYVAPPAYDVGSNAFYIAVAPGTYYTKVSGMAGYVNSCAAVLTFNAAGSQQIPTFAFKYSVKIIAKDELADNMAGLVAHDIQVNTVDADHVVTGNTFYYAATAAGAASGLLTATGYVSIDTLLDTKLALINPGVATQTVVTLSGPTTNACIAAPAGNIPAGTSVTCSGLRFGVKVMVLDELGNAITGLANTAITVNGANATLPASGNALYYKGGTGGLASNLTNYVNVNTVIDTALATTVNTGVATQTVVWLSSAAPCGGGNVPAGTAVFCSAIKFPLKLTVKDEFSTAVTAVAPTFNGALATHADQGAGFNVYYWAVPNVAHALNVAKSGYITLNNAAVTPGSGGITPTDITLDTIGGTAFGAGPIGAGVNTYNGLQWTVHFTNANLQDELGNALTQAAVDTLAIYTENTCTTAATTIKAPYFDDTINVTNEWYAALANSGPTTYFVKYSKAGYIPTCDKVAMTVAQAGPVASPNFLLAGTDGLLYTLKVVIKDELNNALTPNWGGGDNVEVAGTSTPQTSANSMYFALAAPGAFYSSISGYASESLAVDTQLATINPGTNQQTVVNLTGTAPCATGNNVAAGGTVSCSGIRFGIKVFVLDELGNAINGLANNAISIGGNATLPVGGNALYYNHGTAALVSNFTNYVNVDNGAVDTDLTSVQTGAATQTVVWLSKAAAPCNANGSVVTSETVAFCNAIKYPLKLTVKDQFSNNLAGVTALFNGVAATYANQGAGTNVFYWAVPAVAQTLSIAKSGYITNTSGAVTPGSGGTTPTNITVDGTGNLNGSLNTMVAGPGNNTYDGMLWTVAFTAAQDELGNGLVLAGGDTFALYTDSGCTNYATYIAGPYFDVPSTTWYAAVADGANYHAQYKKSGYVAKCDLTAKTVAQAGTIATPDFTLADTDGLPFSMKIVASDELANAMAGMGAGEITVGGTAADQFDGTNTYYYAAAAPGSAWGYTAGFVGINTTTDSKLASIVPGVTAQTVVNLTGTTPCAGASVASGTTVTCDGFKYGTKLIVKDEIALDVTGLAVGSITIGGSNAVHTNPTGAVNTLYYTSTGVLSGTVANYLNVDPLVDTKLADVQIGIDAQTVLNFTGTTACGAGAAIASGTANVTCRGFRYPLKVAVFDQFNTPLTGLTTGPNAITFGGAAPTQADKGTNANEYYWAGVGPAANQLLLSKVGYISLDSDSLPNPNNVTPGTGVDQTSIILTGSAGQGLATAPITFGAAATTRNGMVVQSNVHIKIADSTGAGITNLGNGSNFYFTKAGGVRVMPDIFVEINSIATPGEYEFSIGILTPANMPTNLQIRNVATGTVDFEDSVITSLAGINAAWQDFGTIQLFPKADYIEVTAASPNLAAAGTDVLTIKAKDKSGADITGGPASTMAVKLTISGGSVAPASTKDITATTLGAPTAIGGTSDTTVTGTLVAGVGTVTITDTIVGDGADIIAAATGTVALPYQLLQAHAANTTNLAVNVVAGSATKIVVINPTDTNTTATATVRVEIQDANSNLVTTAVNSFTVNLSGAAKGMNATTGSITGGAGTNAVIVQAAGGFVVLEVIDRTSQTVNITLADNAATGFNVASTQDIIFGSGVANKVVFDALVAGVAGGGAGDISITAKLKDQYDNIVASSASFGLTVTGNAKFTAATMGTLASGANTNTATVQTTGGIITVKLTNNSAATVTVHIADSFSTGYVMPADVIATFAPGALSKIAFSTAAQTHAAGAENATAYTIQAQDANGNALPTVNPAITITLSSNSTGTYAFSAAGGGAWATTTTVTIPITAGSVNIYYRDTKAGSPTISGTSAPLAAVTLIPTIQASPTPLNPSAASITAGTGTAGNDLTQPTHRSANMTIVVNGLTIEIVKYPYTDTLTALGIPANGTSTGKVTITIVDSYGNRKSGVAVTLNSTFAGASISAARQAAAPVSNNTDANGQVVFNVMSTGVGAASFQAQVGGVNYGSAFAVFFSTPDSTPPDVNTTATGLIGASMQNGDLIGSKDPLVIKLNLVDPGADASGVDLTSITLTIKNGAGATVVPAVALNTTQCTVAANCTLTWTPPAAGLAAGDYTVNFTVKDVQGNTASKVWTVSVSASQVLQNIVPIPSDRSAMFNPYKAGNEMIFSFQSPSAGMMFLEVFRRDGRVVYTGSCAISAGYNECQPSPDFALAARNFADGIYVYRIRTTIGSGDQTGKFAIFKQ